VRLDVPSPYENTRIGGRESKRGRPLFGGQLPVTSQQVPGDHFGVGAEVVFHQGSVPGVVQLFARRLFRRADLPPDEDTIAAAILVGGCVERLMDVAYKMDDELQIAARLQLVRLAGFEGPGVLDDLRERSVLLRKGVRLVLLAIQQAQVEKVP